MNGTGEDTASRKLWISSPVAIACAEPKSVSPLWPAGSSGDVMLFMQMPLASEGLSNGGGPVLVLQ